MPNPLPLDPADTIASWNFSGVYAGNAELEAKARENITRLTGLLGKKDSGSTDYELYVSIANTYDLLGDGEREYKALSQALAIDSTTTGLAWNNAASLMLHLGALHTARTAYERMIAAQPQYISYQTTYLNFLTANFASDTPGIEAAFTSAREAVGGIPDILRIRALWLAETGRSAEAIGAWQEVAPLVSPEERANIARDIARLQEKI